MRDRYAEDEDANYPVPYWDHVNNPAVADRHNVEFWTVMMIIKASSKWPPLRWSDFPRKLKGAVLEWTHTAKRMLTKRKP